MIFNVKFISRYTVSALLLAAFAMSFEAVSQEATKTTLMVVDSDEDGVDGEGLRSTLEAYVAEIDIDPVLARAEAPMWDRNTAAGWALEMGRGRGAVAVMWIEPAKETAGGAEVTLVLLDVASGAVVAIPVVLGERTGAAALRVLAASARTIMDTELLDAVQEAEAVTRAVPTPEPWPAPKKVEPRMLEIYAGYLGALSLEGPVFLHGARAGMFQRISKWWMLGLELGFLSGLETRVADIRFNERRLPVRLSVATTWSLAGTHGALVGSFGPEPVWVDSELVGDSDEAGPGALGRLDAAGGVALRWRFPVVWKLFAFASAGAEFLALSHYYVRAGETAVRSSCCRIEWCLGLAVDDL